MAFHHLHPQTNTHLPELDRRFAILAPGQYTPYDLDGPNNFPVELREYFGFDLVVVNPPLLNEVLKSRVKLLLVTTASIEFIIEKLYSALPLGSTKKTTLGVEHGQLANHFAAWGLWADVEHFRTQFVSICAVM